RRPAARGLAVARAAPRRVWVDTGTLPRASTAVASFVPTRRAKATASLMSNERPGLCPGPSLPRMQKNGAGDARVTRLVVQSENRLCNTCVQTQNSLSPLAPGPPAAPARVGCAPPRVYHRSRVTVVSALYPGSRR